MLEKILKRKKSLHLIAFKTHPSIKIIFSLRGTTTGAKHQISPLHSEVAEGHTLSRNQVLVITSTRVSRERQSAAPTRVTTFAENNLSYRTRRCIV